MFCIITKNLLHCENPNFFDSNECTIVNPLFEKKSGIINCNEKKNCWFCLKSFTICLKCIFVHRHSSTILQEGKTLVGNWKNGVNKIFFTALSLSRCVPQTSTLFETARMKGLTNYKIVFKKVFCG